MHLSELLHIETQYIIIVTPSIPIHKHGLTILRICEVLYHSWHWYVEEVTSRLDCIVNVGIAQTESFEPLLAHFQEIIHCWPLEEL